MNRMRLAPWCLVATLLAASAPVLARPSAQAAVAPEKPPVEGVFDRWDADHNGVLSRDEFTRGWAAQAAAARKAALARLHESLRDQFAVVDANDNDAIDAGEYRALLLVRRAGAKAPALAVFDANGDGRLQFGEYMGLVRRLARPQGGEGP